LSGDSCTGNDLGTTGYGAIYMAFRHIEVEAATPTVGAYVSGVDLNQVSSKTIYAEIKLALWKI